MKSILVLSFERALLYFEHILLYFERMLILSFESILTLSFERALLYFESMLLYFESILILFFESFERAFLYFESILLYFESYFLLGTCTFCVLKVYLCILPQCLLQVALKYQYSTGKEKVAINIHFKDANLFAVADATYAYFCLGVEVPCWFGVNNRLVFGV